MAGFLAALPMIGKIASVGMTAANMKNNQQAGQAAAFNDSRNSDMGWDDIFEGQQNGFR